MIAAHRPLPRGIIQTIHLPRRVGFGPLARGDGTGPIGRNRGKQFMAGLRDLGVQPRAALTFEADVLLTGDPLWRR